VVVTPAGLLERAVAIDAARPLLTWYDDSASARVELSVATTANWVAKIAGLLVDEHDVEPGVVVSVALPLHWMTACVLLAVWSCGAAVEMGDGARDLVISDLPGAGVRIEPDPMGVGLSRLVGAEPDHFVPPVPVDPSMPALHLGDRTWDHGALAEAAEHAARHHRLDRSTRVVSTLPLDTADGLDAGLLAPLAAGGSLVLVSNADASLLAERCATEKATHTAGVTVAGLSRLG
jgi:uncharacterized protein (TIGR03089 family)